MLCHVMSYANSATQHIVHVLHGIPSPPPLLLSLPLLIFSTSSQVELLRAEERIAATQRDFNELKNLSQQVRTDNMMLHCVETPAHSDDDRHVCYLSTFSVHAMITPVSSLPFSVPIPCPPQTHFHIPLQHTTLHYTPLSLHFLSTASFFLLFSSPSVLIASPSFFLSQFAEMAGEEKKKQETDFAALVDAVSKYQVNQCPLTSTDLLSSDLTLCVPCPNAPHHIYLPYPFLPRFISPFASATSCSVVITLLFFHNFVTLSVPLHQHYPDFSSAYLCLFFLSPIGTIKAHPSSARIRAEEQKRIAHRTAQSQVRHMREW